MRRSAAESTKQAALRLLLIVNDARQTAQEHLQSAGHSTCLRCNQVRVRSRLLKDQEEQIHSLRLIFAIELAGAESDRHSDRVDGHRTDQLFDEFLAL